MRIVYLSNSVIPSTTANSVHVMKMCQGLADNGMMLSWWRGEGTPPTNRTITRHTAWRLASNSANTT